MKIMPGEYHVREGGGIIKTRCAYEHITDEMIRLEALKANLASGDLIIVQCMDHRRETVLQIAKYWVMSRTDSLQSVENLRGDVHQKEVAEISVAQEGGWWPLVDEPWDGTVNLPAGTGETTHITIPPTDTPTVTKRRGRPPKAAQA